MFSYLRPFFLLVSLRNRSLNFRESFSWFPINAKPCFVETNMSYEWLQISINIAFSLIQLRRKKHWKFSVIKNCLLISFQTTELDRAAALYRKLKPQSKKREKKTWKEFRSIWDLFEVFLRKLGREKFCFAFPARFTTSQLEAREKYISGLQSVAKLLFYSHENF